MNDFLSPHLRRLRNQSANITLEILRWSMRILPRKGIQWVAEGLFSIVYLGLGNLRKICGKNLQSVYGIPKEPHEYDDMTRRIIRNISREMIDLLYYVNRPEELTKIVTMNNEDYLKDALRLGKGVVSVTAHIGNFPLLFVSLVQRGYKINVIIRPMRDNHFSKFMHRLCAQWNINMIQTSPRKKFVKYSLDALRRNELLFILFDEGVPKDAGVSVDFLNSKVTRAIGPMLFHKRMGSPILPVFIVQDEKKHFNITVEPPLVIESSLNEDENKVKNISNLTYIIERLVRKHPLQWGGWLNKKWAFE